MLSIANHFEVYFLTIKLFLIRLIVSQLKSQASDDPIKIEQYMTDSNSPSFKTHDSQTKKSSVIFVLLINV